MKSNWAFSIFAVLALSLATGCGGSGDVGGPAEDPFKVDTRALLSNEQALEHAAGFRFQTDGRTYRWDMRYMEDFSLRNPAVQNPHIIAALERFVASAETCLSRHAAALENVPVLRAKLGLARQTLARIRPREQPRPRD